MQIISNYELGKRTTFKIGGIANNFYIPNNEKELIDVAEKVWKNEGNICILSGGSNLLINDSKKFESVISMENACTNLTYLGEGKFYVGASNRIQEVISFFNDNGYGGFEKLIGLPAMFGGIIYMNAGIGGRKKPVFTIGDFVKSVKALDLESGEIVNLSKEQCLFGHRSSRFQNGHYVILGANIIGREIDKEEAKKIINERLQYCKDNFEYGNGCFGTCFSKCNSVILKTIALLIRGYGGIFFGKRNKNWLVNNGTGTYKDAMKLINVCKTVHHLLCQPIECEVQVWK